MGKWMDILLGTSEVRKNRHRSHEIRKKALHHQNEKNKKIRALYIERNQEEIRLRQKKKTEKKERSKA